MPLALLLLTLSGSTPTLRPDTYQAAHLATPPGLLLPAAQGSKGMNIYRGIRQTVSGSILCVLGTGSAVGGIYLLGQAAAATSDSGRTVFTALGWTFAGFGMLLGAVGIPLLIVGIVNLATADRGPPPVALGLTHSGELAVVF